MTLFKAPIQLDSDRIDPDNNSTHVPKDPQSTGWQWSMSINKSQRPADASHIHSVLAMAVKSLLSSVALAVSCFAVLVAALPTEGEVPSQQHIPEVKSVSDELRSQCANNDGIACIKYKFLDLLDQALRKDTIQVSDNVSVEKNSESVVESEQDNETNAPSGRGFLDEAEEYVKSHDLVVRLPKMLGGARLSFSSRNMDMDEVSMKLKLQDESGVEGKSRKNRRLRRLLIPLMIFVLLKAMTLVPLAVGVLGLKAWNALQLSFFSFVISISLAIFQLCKKIAADNAVVPAAHTSAWDAYKYAAARNFLTQAAGVGATERRLEDADDAQMLAYSGYPVAQYQRG
ncbi:hypothetical protein LSTR_LSTR008420 [Laodelphax striatellus]|uniref:Osiris 19 n=1 Tax=Laodelphax striatellus TaxID=195883 RepID=A0A482XUC0_LAOST|nr:hypothetical protein LSTR_LSTR008420 [Laodelphax striatellus]